MATTTSMPVARDELPQTADGVDAPEAPSPRRRATAWDVLGILVLASLMFALERLVVIVMDTPLGRDRAIEAATAVCWGAFAMGLALVLVRDRPRLSSLPRRLTEVWREPPGPWVAFLLGAVVAVPVLAMHAPVLFLDSDSARLVAAAGYVQRGGWDYFPDTQEPFLPVPVVGSALAVGGLSAAKLVTIVTVQVLAGVVGYITFRITRVMLAAGAAALGLLGLSPIFERAGRLPMYPTMLVLGYFGGWLGYRAMTERGVAWRLVVPAGVCLGLAPEAHGAGQLFLAAPLLLAVFAPNVKAGLRIVAALYAVMVAVSLPRIVVNLWEGGSSYATSPRADYWVTEGYLLELQRNFFHYPGISESVPEFLSKLPDRYVSLLGGQAWVIVALALAGALLCCRGRGRVFVAGTFAFLLLAITAKRIPPFARYYAPFWPGMVILGGACVAALAKHRATLARTATVACSLALVVAASVALRAGVRKADSDSAMVEARPLREMAGMIDDGKGVIGVRAQQSLNSVSDIPTWGAQFLTEDEYATYLTWPSDRAVLEVLERHDIGWVLIDPLRQLENAYNDTWLIPSRGVASRHNPTIGYSRNFCRMLDQDGYLLFKVGACTEHTGLVQADQLPPPPPRFDEGQPPQRFDEGQSEAENPGALGPRDE